MTDRMTAGTLQVDKELYDFINDEALPATGISSEAFWSSFDSLIRDLSPRNRELLATRDRLQADIDAWYQENRDQTVDLPEYKAVLQEIGYLVPEGENFTVSTANVDPEISTIAGPQLVVPVTNARYALNAANARWGSLYDALYGTDVIPEDNGADRAGSYNAVRGNRVIAFARDFLDAAAPLASGSPTGRSGQWPLRTFEIRWVRRCRL
jgi:malate synthase